MRQSIGCFSRDKIWHMLRDDEEASSSPFLLGKRRGKCESCVHPQRQPCPPLWVCLAQPGVPPSLLMPSCLHFTLKYTEAESVEKCANPQRQPCARQPQLSTPFQSKTPAFTHVCQNLCQSRKKVWGHPDTTPSPGTSNQIKVLVGFGTAGTPSWLLSCVLLGKRRGKCESCVHPQRQPCPPLRVCLAQRAQRAVSLHHS